MICNHCGTENKEGDVFCAGCGQFLPKSVQDVPDGSGALTDEGVDQSNGSDGNEQFEEQNLSYGNSDEPQEELSYENGDEPQEEPSCENGDEPQERYTQEPAEQLKEDGRSGYDREERKRVQESVRNSRSQDNSGTQSMPPMTDETLVSDEYKPISAWGYVGYMLLFAVPLIGWVLLLVYSLGGTGNINLRNFARSYWCWILLVVLLAVVGTVIMMVLGVSLNALL